jgi:hypothetical protein
MSRKSAIGAVEQPARTSDSSGAKRRIVQPSLFG